jgi:hypothetical protein
MYVFPLGETPGTTQVDLLKTEGEELDNPHQEKKKNKPDGLYLLNDSLIVT